jgi:hypothetical protein
MGKEYGLLDSAKLAQGMSAVIKALTISAASDTTQNMVLGLRGSEVRCIFGLLAAHGLHASSLR